MELDLANKRAQKGKSLYGTVLKNKDNFEVGDSVMVEGGNEIAIIKYIKPAGPHDFSNIAQIAFKDGHTERIYTAELVKATKKNKIKNESSSDRPIEYKGYTIKPHSDESIWVIYKGSKEVHESESFSDAKDWIDRGGK